jgi:hypothetical protein
VGRRLVEAALDWLRSTGCAHHPTFFSPDRPPRRGGRPAETRRPLTPALDIDYNLRVGGLEKRNRRVLKLLSKMTTVEMEEAS